MEFRLDASQVELQQTVKRFCEDRFPLESMAEREQPGVDRQRWTELADLGVFGLLLPEAEGGSGLGVVDAALVFEQLGSYLVPGPILWTTLLAGLVAGAVSGEVVVGGIDGTQVAEGMAAVEFAADLDRLGVVGPEGVTLCDIGELAPSTRVEPLDPLTPIGRFAGLEGGERVGGSEEANRIRRIGTALTAAALTGIADRALQVAAAYALEREQFGAPIGSFQAIKHLLADMYLRATLAQSAAYAAASVLDDPGSDDPGVAVAGAKVVAGDAAIANASSAVQVLGGMGFTWAMLPHYLLKRAWVLEQTFGTADEHAAARGAAVLSGAS